jgi:hypothetical protein
MQRKWRALIVLILLMRPFWDGVHVLGVSLKRIHHQPYQRFELWETMHAIPADVSQICLLIAYVGQNDLQKGNVCS